MTKDQIIKLLEDEKWYPMIHVTDVEYETSKLLNAILDTIIEKIRDENTTG